MIETRLSSCCEGVKAECSLGMGGGGGVRSYCFPDRANRVSVERPITGKNEP